MPLFGRMIPWSSCSTTSCFPNEWGMNLPHFGRSLTWWACSTPYPRVSCLCCATLRGVTLGNESFLACLKVEMGLRAVRLRDVFGL